TPHHVGPQFGNGAVVQRTPGSFIAGERRVAPRRFLPDALARQHGSHSTPEEIKSNHLSIVANPANPSSRNAFAFRISWLVVLILLSVSSTVQGQATCGSMPGNSMAQG